MNNSDHLMYSTPYSPNILNSLIFEARSLLGRLLLNRPPANALKSRYLNLGAGSTILKGFVNADFFDLVNSIKNNGKAPDWMLDLRFPLNCPSDYWDGVYCEHTMEHLTPIQQLNLLKELYRTMRPGTTIRIIVPDLAKYIAYYSGKKSSEEFHSMWPIKGEAIWSLTQNWIHLSVWDFQLMKRALKEAGFKSIKKRCYGEGYDPKLVKDIKSRSWESLYVEAIK